jgi:hypothetical protein
MKETTRELGVFHQLHRQVLRLNERDVGEAGAKVKHRSRAAARDREAVARWTSPKSPIIFRRLPFGRTFHAVRTYRGTACSENGADGDNDRPRIDHPYI